MGARASAALGGFLGHVFLLLFFILLIPCLSSAQELAQPPQLLSCGPTPCILPNVRLFTNGIGGVYPNEIAVNPTNKNEIIVAASDFNCNGTGIFATEDGGATWPIHRCIGTINTTGDTIAGYDLSGVAYAGGTDDLSSIRLRSSADNGRHWSNAKVVDVEASGIYSLWLALDNSLTSPFKNRFYISSIHGGIFSQGTRIHVSFSGDGQHWAGRFLDKWQYPNIDVFPHVSLGSDGALYVTWLRCGANGPNHDCGDTVVPILLSKSTDGGNTWSAPAIVSHARLSPTFGCAWGYGCLPNTSAAVTNIPVTVIVGSGAAAQVYVVFYNWTGTQMQVEVASSRDGGNTFGSPVRVSTSNFGDQFLPWISATEDGTLGVSWLDRRKDPTNLKYQPFFATSKNGLVFTSSRFLSTTLSDPDGYIGGYSPNLWIDTTLYQFWFDSRSGEPRIELGGVQF